MSSMESFYGGRQGASFVIVKKFDGLDIPKNTVYKNKIVAFAKEITSDGKPILCIGTNPATLAVGPIERNANNYTGEDIEDFGMWGYVKCDATTQYIGTNNINYTFDNGSGGPLYAEGMKQCFEKGGETVSEVGYGEYVIIDTIFGLGEFTNPDNGKVYRRGMNYDDGILGGAEFIGQIVGPKGSSPELEMHTVKEVLDHTESSFRQYKPKLGGSLDGITPGLFFTFIKVDNPEGRPIHKKYYELVETIERIDYDTIFNPKREHLYEKNNNFYVLSEDEETNRNKVYYDCIFKESVDQEVNTSKIYYTKQETLNNDTIDYSWATVRDNHGNITGAWIGFKFPYLVPEIYGQWRSPYYTQQDYDLGRINDLSLIGTRINEIDNFDLFIDNEADSSDRDPNHGDTGHPFYRRWKLQIPEGIQGKSSTELKIYPTIVVKGSTIYKQVTEAGGLSGDSIVLDEDAEIIVDSYWDTFKKGYVSIEVNDETYYAQLEDTAELHYGYLLTWYDAHEDGSDHKWIDIGKYKVISEIHLDEHGWITVSYTCDAPDTLEEALRWIWLDTDEERRRGVQLNEDGTVIIWYNTLDENGDHEFQKYDNILDWIDNTTLDRNGHFKISYNNDSMYDGTHPYNKDISDPTSWSKGWTKDPDFHQASWETDLTWPTQVSLTSEGLLKFLYNNNLITVGEDPIYPSNWEGEGEISTGTEEDPSHGSYSFIIPWIKQVNLDPDGLFKITFNNDKNYNSEDPNWDEVYHNVYKKKIPWITKASLSDTGDLKIYFNNDENKNATIAAGETWVSNAEGEYYKKHIQWVTKVTIDDDGTVHFWYNDGEQAPSPTSKKIKYITNTYVDMDGEDPGEEGAGDQKLHIDFNNGDSYVSPHGFNYIIETVVSDNSVAGTEPYHLLVLYADPEKRPKDSDPKKKSYYSTILGRQVDDWMDLGNVRGLPGGIHIIKDVDDISELEGIKPEEIIPDPQMAGWCVTEGNDNVYVYDYDKDIWYTIGSIGITNVSRIFSITEDEPTNLFEEGIWADLEPVYYAN